MSERERMLNEEPYNSRDQELLDLAHRARGLLSEYAATPSNDSAGRHRVLASLLGEIGDGVWIESPFFCDYGQHIRIGANSFVNVNCVFLDSAVITRRRLYRSSWRYHWGKHHDWRRKHRNIERARGLPRIRSAVHSTPQSGVKLKAVLGL